jgi:hypothetical protein
MSQNDTIAQLQNAVVNPSCQQFPPMQGNLMVGHHPADAVAISAVPFFSLVV